MNEDTNEREREKGNSLPMIHEINGRDSTVGLFTIWWSILHFSAAASGPIYGPPMLLHSFSCFSSALFLSLSFPFSLSLEGRQVSSVCSKRVTSVPGLYERRGKVRPVTGANLPSRREIWIWILFAVGRVRSRILKFAYGRHVKGNDEVERAFCEWRHAPARWISRTPMQKLCPRARRLFRSSGDVTSTFAPLLTGDKICAFFRKMHVAWNRRFDNRQLHFIRLTHRLPTLK